MFVAVTPSWILDRQPTDVIRYEVKQSGHAAMATDQLSNHADATRPWRVPAADRINAIGPAAAVQQTGYSPQPIAQVRAVRSSMIRHLAQIRDTLNKISGATILNISIDGDKLEVEIALADDAGLNELADVLSSHGQIKTNSITLAHPGTGAIVSISGQIARPQPKSQLKPQLKPHSRDEDLNMLRADIQTLRAELRQLSNRLSDQ